MMNSRERVLKTINHQDADRPPMDLGGAASSLNDVAYFNLKKYLKISGDIEPFRQGTTSNYYDERILDRLNIDLRRIIAKRSSRYPVFHEDGSFTNEWGIKYIKQGEYYETRESPLADADESQIKNYAWPKAADIFDTNGLYKEAKRMYSQTEYALVARMPCWGLVDMAFQLRGMERFMLDMITNPSLARCLIEKILEVEIDIYSLILEQIGEFVHIVETCDDLGSQKNLLFSERCFREIVKPGRTALNTEIKKKASQAKIFMHSCGAITRIIPDLIETGIDILNPIQPNAAGMDPEVLKKNFGDQLCFHGCIDTQIAFRGSVTDTEDEVKKKINILYKEGGYIVAPANHIMSDVPVENIVALYQTVENYNIRRKK